MEDGVGGKFLGDGGQGGQCGWLFTTYVYLAESSAETSAERSQRLVTLTKKKAKRSVHHRSQESNKEQNKKEFKNKEHVLESLHKPGIVLLPPTKPGV